MLAELLIAAAIVMMLLGSVFSLVDPTRGALAVQPHVADTQQRLRAAFVRFQTDLMLAGSGPHPTVDVSVARLRAPVLPALVGHRHPPTAGATFAAVQSQIPQNVFQRKLRRTQLRQHIRVLEVEPPELPWPLQSVPRLQFQNLLHRRARPKVVWVPGFRIRLQQLSVRDDSWR